METNPYFEARAQSGQVVVRDPPKFDLESYISNYEGYTRVRRLQHIARLCPPLSLEALRMAVPEAKAGKNVDTYLKLVELVQAIDPGSELAVADEEWTTRKAKENNRETERLEHELRGYKNNLIKESIRVRYSIQESPV